jgi:hypothetical protein
MRTEQNVEERVQQSEKAGFSIGADLRDTIKRNVTGVPVGEENTLEYLAKDYNIKKGLKSEDDRKELLSCIQDAEKYYGINKQGKIARFADAANKVGYYAQAAADVNWFINPLWGAPYKMAVGLFRLATDMLYAPYYLWNTGVEGLKELPMHAAQKLIGTILPGGTILDKMSLKDRQRWLAVERAKKQFLIKKGLYVPLHERLSNAVYKGVDYLKGLFGGSKKPDYDKEPVPQPAFAPAFG